MNQISSKVISRALLYIRTLDDLVQVGQATTSSNSLADITGLTPEQIRKDISSFGKVVGRPRIGYDIQNLKQTLEEFVHSHIVHVALFGVGNLGTAILRYPGFHQDKVKMVAAFDKDLRKVGKEINGINVYDITEALKLIPKKHAEIGVVAVPKEGAQEVVDLMVASGLKGIVNFCPTSVQVPAGVIVRNIDLTIEFHSLFCDLQQVAK